MVISSIVPSMLRLILHQRVSVLEQVVGCERLLTIADQPRLHGHIAAETEGLQLDNKEQSHIACEHEKRAQTNTVASKSTNWAPRMLCCVTVHC